MKYPKNECIDARAFSALILDYEYPAEPAYNMPAYVSCRVLIEDLFQARIIADSRDKAIELFRAGAWKHA